MLYLRPCLPLRVLLVGLVNGGVSLGAEVGRRGAALEVSAEGGRQEGAENDIGATRLKSGLRWLFAIERGAAQLTGRRAERATGGRQT